MNSTSRRKARKYALQALYAWKTSGNDINLIKLQFLQEKNMHCVDVIYFKKIILGVVKNYNYIDKKIKPYLSRTSKQVDPIEKTILRIAFYELLIRNDIPYKVLINEGIELAKIFGAQDSHKFINGVLDKAASKIKKNIND
ncbi:Transcription antitermination protein NusB [Buchnera aphidicola (Tetraneura ulmi)]|uniref:transcription antitermination factor NusB n=1 Tax=Buchnera aphidicola TaxID=9 RepID=UPI003464BC46